MAVTLTIALDDVQAIHAFDEAATSAEDMTAFMDAIGSLLIDGARERIGETNIGPDGVAWPKSLRANLEGGPTLYKTGALHDTVTAIASTNQVQVGSNMPYAGVHQSGATIRPKNKGALFFTLANGQQVMAGAVTIPARPYLGISADEELAITDVAFTIFNDLLDGRVQ